MSTEPVYAIENDLCADEFVDVLKRSTLAERRPVDAPERIEKMVRHANLIVTARTTDGILVGVSRCVTDFAFCCYCSDLAVDRAWQGKGVGQRLIDESAEAAGKEARFFLISAPGAVSFYERIGMQRVDNAFQRAEERQLDAGRP